MKLTEVQYVTRIGPADQAYQRKVDALIGRAAAAADRLIGPSAEHPRESEGHSQWATAWDRTFHREIDEMCAAKGLRRQAHQGSGPKEIK